MINEGSEKEKYLNELNELMLRITADHALELTFDTDGLYCKIVQMISNLFHDAWIIAGICDARIKYVEPKKTEKTFLKCLVRRLKRM